MKLKTLPIILLLLTTVMAANVQTIVDIKPAPKYVLLYYVHKGGPLLSATTAGVQEQRWAINTVAVSTVEAAAEFANSELITEENMIGLYEIKANAKVAMDAKDAPAPKPTIKKWGKKGE